jgi:hypothetical protein
MLKIKCYKTLSRLQHIYFSFGITGQSSSLKATGYTGNNLSIYLEQGLKDKTILLQLFLVVFIQKFCHDVRHFLAEVIVMTDVNTIPVFPYHLNANPCLVKKNLGIIFSFISLIYVIDP